MDKFTSEQKIEFAEYMDKSQKAFPGIPEGLRHQICECYVQNPSVIDGIVEEHKTNNDVFNHLAGLDPRAEAESKIELIEDENEEETKEARSV